MRYNNFSYDDKKSITSQIASIQLPKLKKEFLFMNARKFHARHASLDLKSAWEFIQTKDPYPIYHHNGAITNSNVLARITNLFKDKISSSSIISSSSRAESIGLINQSSQINDCRSIITKGPDNLSRIDNKNNIKRTMHIYNLLKDKRKDEGNQLEFNDLHQKKYKQKSDERNIKFGNIINKFSYKGRHKSLYEEDNLHNQWRSNTFNKSYEIKMPIIIPHERMEKLEDMYSNNKLEFHKRKGMAEYRYQLENSQQRSANKKYAKLLELHPKIFHKRKGELTNLFGGLNHK